MDFKEIELDIDDIIIMKMRAEKELRQTNEFIDNCHATKFLVRTDRVLSELDKMKMLSELDKRIYSAQLTKASLQRAIYNFNKTLYIEEEIREKKADLNGIKINLVNGVFNKDHGA